MKVLVAVMITTEERPTMIVTMRMEWEGIGSAAHNNKSFLIIICCYKYLILSHNIVFLTRMHWTVSKQKFIGSCILNYLYYHNFPAVVHIL